MLADVMSANKRKGTRGKAGGKGSSPKDAPEDLVAAARQYFDLGRVQIGRLKRMEELYLERAHCLNEALVGDDVELDAARSMALQTFLESMAPSEFSHTLEQFQRLPFATDDEARSAFNALRYAHETLMEAWGSYSLSVRAARVKAALRDLESAQLATAGEARAERKQRPRPVEPGWIALSDAADEHGVPYSTLQGWTGSLSSDKRKMVDGFRLLDAKAVARLVRERKEAR